MGAKLPVSTAEKVSLPALSGQLHGSSSPRVALAKETSSEIGGKPQLELISIETEVTGDCYRESYKRYNQHQTFRTEYPGAHFLPKWRFEFIEICNQAK